MLGSSGANLRIVGMGRLDPGDRTQIITHRIPRSVNRLELAALSGTFNMAHPEPAIRRDGLEKFEVLCEVTTRLRPGLTGAKVIDEGSGG